MLHLYTFHCPSINSHTTASFPENLPQRNSCAGQDSKIWSQLVLWLEKKAVADGTLQRLKAPPGQSHDHPPIRSRYQHNPVLSLNSHTPTPNSWSELRNTGSSAWKTPYPHLIWVERTMSRGILQHIKIHRRRPYDCPFLANSNSTSSHFFACATPKHHDYKRMFVSRQTSTKYRYHGRRLFPPLELIS
jgi:hypothetical protein